MKKPMYKKSIVIGLIVLFFGASIIPGALCAPDRSKNVPLPDNRGFLLIPDSTAKSIGMYNPSDGTYLGDLITDTTHFSTPINAVKGPDGNIYVSDQVADSVFVYSPAGSYLYTYADSTDGLDNIRGIDFRGTELFISKGNAPKCIARFSGPHVRLPDFIAGGIDPFDILFLTDGRCLVADIEGSTDNVRLYYANGTLQQILFTVNFPEQIQFDSLAPGAFLNAGFSANVITDFELTGSIVQTTTYSGARGIFRLGNGNLLATSAAGIQEVQPGTGTIIQTEKTGSGRFIEMFATGANQPPNIPSNPNPVDNETNVSLDEILTWTGGDPDIGDFVTYDVYFGTTSPPPMVFNNLSTPSYGPENMTYNAHYYWNIVSWDTHGASTAGPIWNFFTNTDTIPPITTVSLTGTMGGGSWYRSNVTVTLSATDPAPPLRVNIGKGPSGVNHTYYKIDSGSYTVYTVPFKVTGDGTHTVYYYSDDKAGNEETPKSVSFKIDRTAPTIILTVTCSGLLHTHSLFDATVADPASGVAKVEFYVDSVLVGNATAYPYTYEYQGTGKTAQAIVYDVAGNSAMSAVVDQYIPNDYAPNSQSSSQSAVLRTLQ